MLDTEKPKQFGTINLKGGEQDHMAECQKLLPFLLEIDLSQKGMEISKFEKVLRVLEIVRFSEESFPWMMGLGFNEKGNVEKIDLISDPHYDETSINHSIFTGQVLEFPNFYELWEKPEIFINNISHVASYDGKRKPYDVIMAGTKSRILVLGTPNDNFLAKKDVIYELVK
jgi:hypothetical protein